MRFREKHGVRKEHRRRQLKALPGSPRLLPGGAEAGLMGGGRERAGGGAARSVRQRAPPSPRGLSGATGAGNGPGGTGAPAAAPRCYFNLGCRGAGRHEVTVAGSGGFRCREWCVLTNG